MRKIPSLFCRNYDGDHLVRDEVVPGCEWVSAGEGIATRKWDGTACLFQGGKLYKRYDAKNGKPAPEGFLPAQAADPVTGHWPGWLLVNPEKPEDRWHVEVISAVDAITGSQRYLALPDGTYELCGPKINGNHEKLEKHTLIPHGRHPVDAPRAFAPLREWLAANEMEGVVWHHSDGRMCKIKRRDFGLLWGSR